MSNRIEGAAKRAKSMGNHVWTENDTILCLYFTKFGVKNTYFKDKFELCDFIDTSDGSLIKQSMNIRFLMGHTTNVLTDYSHIQEEVYQKYGKMTQYQLFEIVKQITDHDKVQRDRILIKMGKDPSKFRKL